MGPLALVINFVLQFLALFGSLLDRFVSSFARADVLSIFKLDAD